MQIVGAANLGMPSGNVLQADGKGHQMLSVETGEFLRSADDVGELIVGIHNGKPIYLRGGQCEAGAQQAQRHVWFTQGAADPAAGNTTAVPAGQTYPAVTLTVTKPRQNAVDVARAARARLDELRNTVPPANVR